MRPLGDRRLRRTALAALVAGTAARPGSTFCEPTWYSACGRDSFES